MRPEPLAVTLEDCVARDWQSLPEEAERKDCFHYSSHCHAKAVEAEAAGNEKAGAVWRLLGAVTSTALRAHDRAEPFVPDWLASFTDDHLNLFAALVPDVKDAELRARLCDVLWMRRHDVEMTRRAVDSYLEAACTLEKQRERRSYWRDCADRIERATHLGRQLGQESPEFKKAIATTEQVLQRLSDQDDSPLSAALMELLQDYKQGDGTFYTPEAEKLSKRAEAAQQWEVARRYRHVQAEWLWMAGLNEEARRARLEVAEIYVCEGEARVASSGAVRYLQACPHLERAIKAYRDIGGPGTRERIAEIYRMLREWQQHAMPELGMMPRHTIKLDEADVALRETAIEAVRAKSVLEAVMMLGALPLIQGSAQLRAQSEEYVRTSPVAMLFPFKAHTSVGLVSGRPVEKPQTAEERLQIEADHQCHTHANTIRQFKVELMIEPALAQINAEHNPHLYDLRPLVIDNPFVPSGREFLFLKGLHAGLTGDFVTAVHLLVPQVENSLRHLLEEHGVTASGLTRQDTQSWFDLNRMLTTPEVEQKLSELLDEDVVFHLKGVLVHHFGANLRNELAHGTLGVGELNGFYAAQCVFVWWLTLHLCLRRFLTALPEEKAAPHP
jgi:hypothetical protein